MCVLAFHIQAKLISNHEYSSSGKNKGEWERDREIERRSRSRLGKQNFGGSVLNCVWDKTIWQTVYFDLKAATTRVTFATQAHPRTYTHTLLQIDVIVIVVPLLPPPLLLLLLMPLLHVCVFLQRKRKTSTAQHSTAQHSTAHHTQFMLHVLALLWVAFCCVLNSFHTLRHPQNIT